jgi:hypothetical protein
MSAAAFGHARASAWAAHAATPAPTWVTLVALATFVLFVLFVLGLALVGIRWVRGREDDDGHWWGPGGGGPHRLGPQGSDSPSGDLAWWPEFEHQFAAYLATQRANAR